MTDVARVGVGVIIVKDGRVLLHKRKGAHGAGTWSFPGGHLEFCETWEDCAIRETMEECGIKIFNPHFVAATNDVFPEEHKHYVTIYMQAESFEGEPKILEPDRCEIWEWFEFDALPSPLFKPLENLFKSDFCTVRD